MQLSSFTSIAFRRYQSTISGSFQVVEIIETFVSYMESLDRCVW